MRILSDERRSRSASALDKLLLQHLIDCFALGDGKSSVVTDVIIGRTLAKHLGVANISANRIGMVNVKEYEVSPTLLLALVG
mmetsp:Transcript_25031/g.76070  ORF Transcript_25031/g.76070 Transcript_25031/m.76070 type:complete len:82 (+) Transcript_25031:384-629(+)